MSAWADCFRHSHETVEEPSSLRRPPFSILESRPLTIILKVLPGPFIHCPTAEQRLGPALQVASANLNRFDLVTSVHASFVPEPASPASRNNLWLEALFKRILAFSLPNDLARHLFLSILQI